MKEIIKSLTEIVGGGFVSDHLEENFLAMDPKTTPPYKPAIVVKPVTTREVQEIMKLASNEKIPVVPMGAGLVLSGLKPALKGGIILDMKRMNRIIEVNRTSRYAVVEAGVNQGTLQSYLKKKYPDLKHSMPDAPSIATIAGNIIIHGLGHLSHCGGFHSDMLNGLEVVLPTGEIVKIGSCATSSYWFSRAPLPDLSGLFLGWAGTTGVVTKMSIKLFPDYKYNDLGIFVVEDPDLVPDILYRISGVQLAEDLTAWMTPKPEWAKGFQHLNINYGASTKEELIWKRNLIQASVKNYIDEKIGGFLPLPPPMKKPFLEIPQKQIVRFADLKKGVGFEYVGAIMPVELFGNAYRKGLEIAERHQTTYSMGARIIGINHCMMFFYAYAYNSGDKNDIKKVQQALEETNNATLSMGGIPWNTEASVQKQIIQKMDPNMFNLINKIKSVIDPEKIMSPGNWEV